jgi:hypothetical protein
MKTKSLRPAVSAARLAAACAFFLVGRLVAAPLALPTAVHTKPDSAAPTITYLKPGAEPKAVADAVATTPAGWMAIELPGPFEGYVENKDLSKSLDVKPGASIRLLPKNDAGVLAIAEKNEKATITGLRGKWTQISLERPLVAYIHIGSTPGYLPPIATTPASAPTQPATAPASSSAAQPAAGAAPMSPPPVTPNAYGVGAAGQPAPVVSLADPNALPRQFAGKFVSTQSPFRPRRPYDYALNDDAGKRYAYLDVSKLLQTDQIEKYLDHNVVVFGAARTAPGGKDIVIDVETLQLR